MALSDLLANLRVDLGDEDGVLFQDAVLTRCIQRSALQIANDLEITLALSNGEVVPEPTGETRELLLLLARIYACQVKRASTANAFSFSSGDKRVDKTSQPEQWAKLEADLWAQYKARLADIKPAAAVTEDDYFITPNLAPVICEQGSRHHGHEHGHSFCW